MTRRDLIRSALLAPLAFAAAKVLPRKAIAAGAPPYAAPAGMTWHRWPPTTAVRFDCSGTGPQAVEIWDGRRWVLV